MYTTQNAIKLYLFTLCAYLITLLDSKATYPLKDVAFDRNVYHLHVNR